MSFVGGRYEFDIFVSYSHGTPAYGENETDLKRWTHAFVRELQEDISYSPQARDRKVKIWYDERLKGNRYLTKQLKEKIASSAVLIIIMTNEYLDSDWCTSERQWFEAELARRGHDVESIFVIRAMPTDWSRWPAFLKDEQQETVTGFAFHREGGDMAARPFGWPRPADREFYEALSKVSSALAERLQAIRAENETRAAPKPGAPGPGLEEPGEVYVTSDRYEETTSLVGPTPLELFISYSHKDEALRERLENHLSLLKRQGIIHAWHDRRIVAGQKWAGVIDEHLNSAAVILLLISADFLASDYCYELEMRRALARHDAGEARVIPVILRSVDWQHGAPFFRLQALPKDGKPVTSWANEDEAFTDIARGIRTAVELMRRRGQGLVESMSPLIESLPRYVRPGLDAIDPGAVDPTSLRHACGIAQGKPLDESSHEVELEGPVFVALGTADIAPHRETLRDQLIQGGMKLLPAPDLALETLSAELLDANLGASRVFVQLLGILPGPPANGGPGCVQRQFESAIEKGIPTVLWRDDRIPVEVINDESYRNFIENLTPRHKIPLGDIVTAVREALARQEGAALVTAYLQAHAAAQNQFNRVKRALEDENCIVLPLKPPEPRAAMAEIQAEDKHRRSLFAKCHGFLLLYSDGALVDWLKEQLFDFVRERPRIRREFHRELDPLVIDLVGDAQPIAEAMGIDVVGWTEPPGAAPVKAWLRARAS